MVHLLRDTCNYHDRMGASITLQLKFYNNTVQWKEFETSCHHLLEVQHA